MKFNELCECYDLEEGKVMDFLKAAGKKFKKEISKFSKKQTMALYKIVPLAVTAGLVAGPQLNAMVMHTLEKAGIEMDAEEVFHVIHVAEKILETGMHLAG